METYRELQYYYQLKDELKNINIFKKIIKEVCKDELIDSKKIIKNDMSINDCWDFIYNYLYDDDKTKYMYDLLKKYNYNFNQDILFAMKLLSKYTKDDKLIIKCLLFSPIINDIKNNKKGYTLYTTNCGNICIKRANEYYSSNKIISDYINNNKLKNQCHINSLFLTFNGNNFLSIISKCKNEFEGGFFHSYNLTKNNNIITDLSHNIVINKNKFDKIFLPKELSILNKKQILIKLNNLPEMDDEKVFFDLYKIGLYEEANNNKKLIK